MFFQPFCFDMITAVKNTGAPMENESDVTHFIRLLPRLEVQAPYMIQSAERLFKEEKFSPGCALPTNPVLLARDLGGIIVQVARHHVLTCPRCTIGYKTMSISLYLMSDYLISIRSHGTQTVFGEKIIGILLPNEPCHHSGGPTLRDSIRHWDPSQTFH